MHTRTRTRNACARTRAERKNMKKLIEVLKRIAIALEDIAEMEIKRNEMIEDDIKSNNQFRNEYIEVNKAINNIYGNIEED